MQPDIHHKTMSLIASSDAPRAVSPDRNHHSKPAAENLPLSVLLIDRQPFFRAGVRDAMHLTGWLRVVGEADDSRQASVIAGQVKPGFILLDGSCSSATGVEIVRLRQRFPEACIVAFTNSSQPGAEDELVASGADGCFPRGGEPEELLTLLRAFYTRKRSASQSGTGPPIPPLTSGRLTQRERQILPLIIQGSTAAEVGAAVGLSSRTVETHSANIRRKLGAHSRMDLVRSALNVGW